MTNPLVAEAQSSTTWYTGLGLAEDAAQISNGIQNDSWVDGTLGGVGGALDMLGMVIDPLGSLVAWGVGWLMEHVRPLKEALDWLAGQPDEIAAHAATWRNVAAATAATQQRFADAIQSQTAGWSGASGDAYRHHTGQHLDVLGGIAKASEGISYAVEGAGLLVGLVRGIVRDLIAQFVATLAARLPQWLAEAGLTLGIGTPVVIGQVATLVAKWVDRIQGFIRALLNSLRRLSGKLTDLTGVLDDLKDALRKLSRFDPTEAASDATSAVRQTGGELRRPRGDIDFEEDWANQAYDTFRASDDELPAVAATAQEHGFSSEDISQIKITCSARNMCLICTATTSLAVSTPTHAWRRPGSDSLTAIRIRRTSTCCATSVSRRNTWPAPAIPATGAPTPPRSMQAIHGILKRRPGTASATSGGTEGARSA